MTNNRLRDKDLDKTVMFHFPRLQPHIEEKWIKGRGYRKNVYTKIFFIKVNANAARPYLVIVWDNRGFGGDLNIEVFEYKKTKQVRLIVDMS